MSEGIVERSGHLGEALYNILPAALSKHDEAKSARCAQMLAVPFFSACALLRRFLELSGSLISRLL
jgi:hypothetical protein